MARTSSALIGIGGTVLPIRSHAASASSPIRALQIDGGFVSNRVPFVVRVILGMSNLSNTGAIPVVSTCRGQTII